MKRNILFLVFLIFTISFFVGCTKERLPEDEYAKLAIKAYKDAKYNDAIGYYKMLFSFYPDSPKKSEYKRGYFDALAKLAETSEKPLAKGYMDELKSFSPESDTLLAWLEFESAEKLADSTESEKLFKTISFKNYLLAAQYALNRAKYSSSLRAYDKALEVHPSDTMGYKAAFLAGFICSEYLKDTARAKTYYQIVVDKYPNSDLADDAEWSLKNIGKSVDEIKFAGSQDSTDIK